MEDRARRFGLSVVICALVFRLFATGLPAKAIAALQNETFFAFLTYLETGRDVRFSPSLEAFSPDFMESPAPAPLPASEAALPSFSDPDAVELYYASTKEPDIAALMARPLQWQLRGTEPTVLILHTHSTESYTKAGEVYRETASWRTADENYNMLSIGAQVQALLQENGITVIHDKELHDYPSYNGAYTRTRETIRAYLDAYPTIRLVLDLHRDAAGEGGNQMRTHATVDGQKAAQLMLVIGTNYDSYEDNLSLALKLHAQLEAQCPGITRPLQLRAARFNQDLNAGSLLIEVGAAGNTHAEAALAAGELAKAITALANGTD